LVPIGGFCRMHGEDTGDSDEGALSGKKVSQRMWIMASGSIMNFLLALAIFVVLVMLTGYPTTAIRQLVADMPAAQNGLLPGDRITHINGSRVNIYEDILFELSLSGGKPVDVTFFRDGLQQTKTIVPQTNEAGEFKIGFAPNYRGGILSEKTPEYQRVGVFDTVLTAFFQIIFYVKATVVGVLRLVTGRANMGEMSGIIGITGIIGETYEAASKISFLSVVLSLANLCALLSANLGVINLLPLPALDGGRLVFLTLEAIRRKPVPPEREGMIHFVGFVLLMIFAVFIAYLDIVKQL